MITPESTNPTGHPTRGAPLPPPAESRDVYVYSDGQGREPHEDYDNTIYWCLETP